MPIPQHPFRSLW
jgi:hypothetical protein